MEYDIDENAVIMAKNIYDTVGKKKAVMLFMDEEIDAYVKTHACEKVAEYECVTKIFSVYRTVHKGTEFVFCQAPLGGAGAVQIMENLIAGGAKEIIAAGCCGALVEDGEGDFFIPTAALRQEGTSYHYLPPAREVELHEKAITAIEKALQNNGLHYRTCKTWTTDGFYRETKEMVSYRKEECLCRHGLSCSRSCRRHLHVAVATDARPRYYGRRHFSAAGSGDGADFKSSAQHSASLLRKTASDFPPGWPYLYA